MIKLVAFDWNGTLLADVSAVIKTYDIILPAFGLKPVSLKRFQEIFEIPIINYWIKMGFKEKDFYKNGDKIQLLFQHHYEFFAKKSRTRAGTRATLIWLKKQNIECIIYSNHIVPEIKKHLPRLKIENYITHILAREPGDHSHLHSRGKAEKLRKFVQLKKIKPSEVVSVGDTGEEIEIGKEFGYHTVAISGGFNSIKRLKKHHPDFLIHNMRELIGVIKKLNS